MAALRRKDLVKDGKYNRAEIMRRAWMYMKNPLTPCRSFKAALHKAWVDAKVQLELNQLDDEPCFNKNVSVAMLRSVSCSDNMRRGNVCW